MEKRSGGGVEGGGSGASAPRAGGAGTNLEVSGCFFGVSCTGGFPDFDERGGNGRLDVKDEGDVGRRWVCGGVSGGEFWIEQGEKLTWEER